MISRHRGKKRYTAMKLAVVLMLLAGIWAGGLFLFVERLPKSVEDATTVTEAIVVLTGGSGRVRAGLDLLLAGRAERMFVSGVYRGVDVDSLFARFFGTARQHRKSH